MLRNSPRLHHAVQDPHPRLGSGSEKTDNRPPNLEPRLVLTESPENPRPQTTLPHVRQLLGKPVLILGAAVHFAFAAMLDRPQVHPHLSDLSPLLLFLELLPFRLQNYLELGPIPNKGEVKFKACRLLRK